MKVIVGVGVPGCGKTTYLKPLAAEMGMAYINPDDIRMELTGDPTDHTQETRVWDTVHERLVKVLQNGGAIVDATYTKLKDRRQLIELCKTNGADEIIAYWFNVPLEICQERNAQRQRVVPKDVLAKMHNRLQLNPPTTGEGFSKVLEIVA